MHCQQGGDGCEGKVLLDAFRRFLGGFEPFLGSCSSQMVTGLTDQGCWPCAEVGHWSNRCYGSVGPARAKLMQPLCFVKRFACIRPMGAFMCAGGALCGFRALVWLCLLFA
jgi:hypothetical protein